MENREGRGGEVDHFNIFHVRVRGKDLGQRLRRGKKKLTAFRDLRVVTRGEMYRSEC